MIKLIKPDVQSQNRKRQSNARNLFKNINKDSGAFIVHFEQISHIAVMFLLLTFNK